MLNLPVVADDQVRSVVWQGDPIQYDIELAQLGSGADHFIVPNPDVIVKLDRVIKKIPNTIRCIVWKCKGEWIAKKFHDKWNPRLGYLDIEVPDNALDINLIWKKNTDLDPLMTFEDDPYQEYTPTLTDCSYELVWYIDPRFTDNKRIWARKCYPALTKTQGVKYMGYLIPKIEIELNPDLPDMNLDLDSMCPPYDDMAHERAYMLDKKHAPFEDIWVVKIRPAYRTPKPLIWVGIITPEFDVVYNEKLPGMDYEIDYNIPWRDFKFEHMWMLDKKHVEQVLDEEIWAFKIVPSYKTEGVKVVGSVSPVMKIEYNPKIPKTNYDIDYEIPYHDLAFEHVWMLDKKHTPKWKNQAWAIKVRYTDNVIGTKIMGDISPTFGVEFNPELPELNYDTDYTIPHYDFEYTHMWMLDKKHTVNLIEQIWAFKLIPPGPSKGVKIVGDVSPVPTIEYNPELEGYSFDGIEYDIQYHDLDFTHTWMLDKQYSGKFDIWAMKINYVDNPNGYKELGHISPAAIVVYNKSLKNLKFELDYVIPYHDREYQHVWYMDPAYTNGEKIWAAKMYVSEDAEGEKDMGIVTPSIPDTLDVIFVSYHQPNAEENWQRVREKAPWAKRIDGVKGILEAHQAAAKLSRTDMFYVVDGDAYLTDEWEFNYQPSLFDRDCAYVWNSQNPVNELLYGYGGVKLFDKKSILKIKKWDTLDLTTSLPKLKVIETTSNITKFNTDPFSTWRSSFRECVKLCYNIHINPDDPTHLQRLYQWKNIGNGEYGEYSTAAAHQAEKFVTKTKNKLTTLININNRSWLEQQFDQQYPGVRTNA